MRPIIFSLAIQILFSTFLNAQSSETKQNGLVVKLSATWCPVCAGAAWNSYQWLFDNVKSNAVYLTAHSSSTSRLFSQTSQDLIRNFDLTAYQPAFYLNGINKGSGGSVTEKEIKNTIEDDAKQAPVATLKTVARATGNTSIKAQVSLLFPKAVSGSFSIGLYLVEKSVKEVQTGLSGTVEHKNVLRNSFFTQTFGEELTGSSFSAGYTKTISASINLPASSQASNFEVVAVLWNKKGTKFEFVNVHSTSDMAGVLTSLSEKVDEGFHFVLMNASRSNVEFQFSSEMKQFNDINISLRDILGRTILVKRNIPLTSEVETCHFSNLNLVPGSYILSFESPAFILSRKVLIE
jgi:hypothetical protein